MTYLGVVMMLPGASGFAPFLVTTTGVCLFGFLVRFVCRWYGVQASVTSPPFPNRRNLDRFSVRYIAQIQELDGWKLTKKVKVTDLSEDGARIYAGWELPVGALVRLRIPKIKSAVTGCVRTCVKREFGYDIGLEFRGNLYRTAV